MVSSGTSAGVAECAISVSVVPKGVVVSVGGVPGGTVFSIYLPSFCSDWILFAGFSDVVAKGVVCCFGFRQHLPQGGPVGCVLRARSCLFHEVFCKVKSVGEHFSGG